MANKTSKKNMRRGMPENAITFTRASTLKKHFDKKKVIKFHVGCIHREALSATEKGIDHLIAHQIPDSVRKSVVKRLLKEGFTIKKTSMPDQILICWKLK